MNHPLNYEGIVAFRSDYMEDFPVKVLRYRKEYLVVPDWSTNHDDGDEDDGEHKLAVAMTAGRAG